MTRKLELRGRLWLVLLVLIAMAVALLVRTAYLAANGANRAKTNLLLMTRSPHSLDDLNRQIVKIERMSGDIENYSLGEIQRALEQTTDIVRRANIELKAQSDAWIKIKDEASKGARSYEQIRSDLDKIKYLQDAEIVRLNAVLDDAKRPSLVSDAGAFLASFLLGVLSSILATYLYDWWRSRRIANSE